MACDRCRGNGIVAIIPFYLKRILCFATLFMFLVSCAKDTKSDDMEVAPALPSISASETSLTFSAEGGSDNVIVISTFEWEIIDHPSWIKISPSLGYKGTTSLSIVADSNSSGTAREGSVLLGNPSLSSSVSISVSQVGAQYESLESIPVKGNVSIKMIRVEGGTFTMGTTPEQELGHSVEEEPTHSVTLSTYYIGETEVTQELWETVMRSNPSDFKGSQRPVECVSWNDCQTFITKLKSLTGREFRLPTEAEWEYAARGGSKSRGYAYAGSNEIEDVAWYYSNTGLMYNHSEVRQKTPNELGLYDMSGNVWEWCNDWYGNYSPDAQTDPTGPDFGSKRVKRGGGWNCSAGLCKVALRRSEAPNYKNFSLGLRLAL